MILDPVIFSIGPISIHWYSLAYVLGILLAYWYLHKLDYDRIFTKDFYDSLLTALIIGIIFGGRLGYVLIYDPTFYINHPIYIFKTWEGGMSFHGGLVGAVCAIMITCKIHKVPILYTLDLNACGTPIGILLGRIGNFINGELFGRVTNMPWGMTFPESGDDLLRHPVQLYEAIVEGLLLFIIINLIFFFTETRFYRGRITGLAVIWYGTVRFLVEFFREPDYHIGYLWFNLTVGQLLSFPMLIIGGFLCLRVQYLKFDTKPDI
jgi:phosphatidylglycerol---prolipoprotein diacylglyceryl transferase